MDLKEHIEAIREGIRKGQYSNEASVSQGIVLRLLSSLGWPTYNTQVVCPEYSLEGRRVDFGLCHPANKPIAFVEVKQIGQSEKAERQLFEYAFHSGIPLAILTDGQQWNFFLPAEQGSYGERRLYKLDIVERDVTECINRLERYLSYAAVCTGRAIEAARKDYQNVTKDRQIVQTLPIALRALIEEEDELLLELIADRVESLCGFKPDPDSVAQFLKEEKSQPERGSSVRARQEPPAMRVADADPPLYANSAGSSLWYEIESVRRTAASARDVLIGLFRSLAARDATFLERFAALPKHGRTRRYLAKSPESLYPGRADLAQAFSVEVVPGWWLGVNLSRVAVERISEMAADVAGLTYDHDLKIFLNS